MKAIAFGRLRKTKVMKKLNTIEKMKNYGE